MHPSSGGESFEIMRTPSGLTASELLYGRADLKYLPPHDFARLEYGRMLWKNRRTRARLMAHWQDKRHPYRERFARSRQLILALLSAPVAEFQEIVEDHNTSLRAAIREIPPVFGHFWTDSVNAEPPMH